MAHKNIQFEAEEGIGILTINRPKALNALNSETIKEIRSVLADVKVDETVKVLIITGAGEKAFGAGADVGEIKELGLNEGFDFLRRGHEMNHEIETLGKATIAAINGLALGGGLELAMSCTLRIASEESRLGLPELALGVIPGFGGTQRLARLIGKGRALWYMLTGDMMDAAQAADFGLVNLMVKPDELMEKAIEAAKKIMSKGPLAVKMALFAVEYGTETDLETGLVLESGLASLTVASEDKSEGIAAFFEKRKPEYKGK